MKSIINGKTYNTETATEICSLPCHHYSGDFHYHDTSLYVTKKGAFFLAGSGGPCSMWREPMQGGSWSGGEGIKLLSEADARQHMESAGCGPEVYEICGFAIDEG